MKKLLYLSLIALCITTHAQDYIAYQTVINRADNDIVKHDLNMAALRLDSLYQNYTFIYAKHCFKALQINCAINDYANANKWLAKSFVQGIPLWIIRNNDITKQVWNNTATLQTIHNYDSLRSIYYSHIRKDIAQTIDSLFTVDQNKTNKVNNGFLLLRHTLFGLNWIKNNNAQFKKIKSITEMYGFPGEQLIGLPEFMQDSAQYYKYFYKNGALSDYRSYIMLVHYYSRPNKDINNLLFKNVQSGYIPAYQFGALNDFVARWGKTKNTNEYYYNVWHKDPNTSNNILLIDQRRNSIGLPNYAEQMRNDTLLKDRLKYNTMHSSIFME